MGRGRRCRGVEGGARNDTVNAAGVGVDKGGRGKKQREGRRRIRRGRPERDRMLRGGLERRRGCGEEGEKGKGAEGTGKPGVQRNLREERCGTKPSGKRLGSRWKCAHDRGGGPGEGAEGAASERGSDECRGEFPLKVRQMVRADKGMAGGVVHQGDDEGKSRAVRLRGGRDGGEGGGCGERERAWR